MHLWNRTRPADRIAAFGVVALSALLPVLCPAFANALTAQLLYVGYGFSPGSDLSRPLGVFYDRHTSECYIADTGNHQVVVYNDNGMPIFRFYHHVTVNGEDRLGEPKHLAVDAEGQIYITDALVPYLDILDRNGRKIASVEPPYEACGEHIRFDGVAIGPDSKIYTAVTCHGERVVAVIGPDLELERLIRLHGKNLGETCITALDIGADGKIYVTDPCAEVMVQIYNPDGGFETGFGKHDSGFENFSHPSGISVLPSGEMWIVDSIRQVVSCFSSGGEFVSYVGGKGDHPGAFNYPSGIDTDGADRLFVVERAGNRYQCFRIVRDDVETAGK